MCVSLCVCVIIVIKGKETINLIVVGDMGRVGDGKENRGNDIIL